MNQENLDEGRVYPPLSNIRDVSIKIAVKIAEFCYKKNLAAHYPEPEDKAAYIRSQLYSTEYESFIPMMYNWPNKL